MSSLAKKRRQFILLSLIVPTLLLIGFVVFPAIDLVRMSFTNWDGYSESSQFIGFGNYISMFQNKDLWQSLMNNAVYFVVHLCMIPIELAFAVLLVSKLKGAKFYKTMVFMPYIINGVAIAYAFSYFFSPINGAFDAILELLRLGMLKGTGCLTRRLLILSCHSCRYGGFPATILSCLWRLSSPFLRMCRKRQGWMEPMPGRCLSISRSQPSC